MSQSEALTYLGGKTVYWINLDRSTDRREQFEESVAPLFHRAIRVRAHDWQHVSDETAARFVAEWNATWERNNHLGVFMHVPQSRNNYRVQTAKASCAIRQSHLIALSHGIDNENVDRFMVAEDDILPRDALWKESIPAPPIDADMAIWSGGLPMAAVRTDDKEYLAGHPLRWVRVTDAQVFNTLGAGLYEVSKSAAIMIRNVILEYRMGPYDHAWGFALSALNVYRLRPNAFPQAGPSVRNSANRKPAVERTKEIA